MRLHGEEVCCTLETWQKRLNIKPLPGGQQIDNGDGIALRLHPIVKLLIFTTRFAPEKVGTARYVELLAGGLAQRGLDLKVLAPAYGRAHPEDAGLDYPVERIPGGNIPFIPWRYQRARAALSRAVAHWRPDVVWAANGMATRVAGLLLGELCMPLIGTVHGTDVARRLPGRTPWTWLESVPQRRFYTRARRLLTNSSFTRQLLVDKGVDPDKVKVVHLGVKMPVGVEETKAGAPGRHPQWQGRPLLLHHARGDLGDFKLRIDLDSDTGQLLVPLKQ